VTTLCFEADQKLCSMMRVPYQPRPGRRVVTSWTSHASVDQIAAEVGYAEGVTLRALLRRRLGRGVREIRRSL
jgi:hypothetical protein